MLVPAAESVLIQTIRLQGIVLDEARAPVPGARIVFQVRNHLSLETVSDTAGQFVLESPPAQSGTLYVEAGGFARVEREWNRADLPVQIVILLAPAPIAEQVTIIANRTESRLEDAAASVRVLSSAQLSSTSALAIDDALRQVPGFQLFRRSGSRTANPTSQGVSLRGVGATGASRALVLADGIPLNDPFGGWVYWARIPRESLSRIEVLRGGASDLYGSGAMGGVVNLITRETRAPVLRVESSYGNQKTGDASLFTAGRHGNWGASFAAGAFKSAGYVLIPENESGRVDTPANSRHSNANFKIDYAWEDSTRIFVQASYFRETRANGTPLQTNRTHIRQISAGGDWRGQRTGKASLRLYVSTQLFDQTFSAIAADRNTENLTRVQRVPSQMAGLGFQWSQTLRSRHTMVLGIDAREVRGASDEIVFVQSQASSFVNAGGRERDLGLFLKDILRVTPRLFVGVGARFDRWLNYRSHADSRPVGLAGPSTVQAFSERAETAVSPQGSVLYKPRDSVSLFASAYKAFRAPTLNELYRSFRVGNVLTLANPSLSAEALKGGEGGMRVSPFEDKVSIRGSFFWTEIDRPVANVTVNSSPGLITRERRNLGRTRSRGVELEGEINFAEYLSASAGYLFADATVHDFPANRTLEGLRIPQVARHNVTFQLNYTNPSKLNFGLQARIAGAQFDDDLNLFRLPGYFTVDGLASRRVNSHLEVFAAAENLFNQRYVIGRTPVTSVAPPLLFRLGFRLHLGS